MSYFCRYLDVQFWICIAHSRKLLTSIGPAAEECTKIIERALDIIRRLTTEKLSDHSFKYYLAQAEYVNCFVS